MSITTQAVYSGGVLRLLQSLALAEGETVEVTSAKKKTPSTEHDIIRRIQACKSYGEWLEVTKSLPTDDDGYDIVKAVDANRRWSGE